MNRRQFVSSGLAMTGAALSGNNRGICAETRGDDHAEHSSRDALSSVQPGEDAVIGGEGLAVMPLYALLQLPGDGPPVL